MPAMPTEMLDVHLQDDEITGGGRYVISNGLTKREMFAMHIMAGMAASSHGYSDYKYMALDAVKKADALLLALNQKQ